MCGRRQNGAVHRLRDLPWPALRKDVVLPAIGRVLDGAAAEREVDRALRSHRELSRDERTAAAEAIFGVALWRRRLRWEASGSRIPRCCSSASCATSPQCRKRWRPRSPALLLRRAGPMRRCGLRIGGRFRTGWKRTSSPSLAVTPRPSVPRWPCRARFACAQTGSSAPARSLRAGSLPKESRPGPPPARRTLSTSQGRNPNLFGSQAWRDGLFEPQDEGSQLVGLLVEPLAGETVLDLCAGAGGKSLLLAAEGARVLAHDPDRARTSRLRTRAARAHAQERIAVVPAPVAADRVLVDAPCSELGTLRRGPDARWRIDPARFASLPALQRQLLETAAALARERIVYATCTVRRAENEEVAAAFEQGHPELRRARTLRLLPHLEGTDGFFAVAWDRLRR